MKYRILIDDVWNFDESGYAIGIGQKSKVLVGVKKKAFSVQGGNREWATSIEAIRTTSEVFPPTFVLAGKLQFS